MLKSLTFSLIATIIAVCFISSTQHVFAAYDAFHNVCSLNSSSAVCQDTEPVPTTDPVITLIKAAVEVISFLTGAAAVILIVISGIKFATSGGDSNAVSSAKGTLTYALVGLLIAAVAQLLIVFVLHYIQVS